MVALGFLALVVLALAWARERGKRLRAERALEKESAGQDEALRTAMAFQSVARGAREKWIACANSAIELRNECDDLQDENGRLLAEVERLRGRLKPTCAGTENTTPSRVQGLSEDEIRDRELINVLNYNGTEAGQIGFEE